MPRLPEVLMSDPFSSLWERMCVVIKWKSEGCLGRVWGTNGCCPELVMP